MTASLLARLQARGVLRLDETLAELFGKQADLLHAEFRPVTMDSVLRHTAGLPGDISAGMLDGLDASWTIERQRAWISTKLLSRRPAYPPGSKFEYSNWGYVIAGHLAEQKTGRSWELLMAEEVFDPLGMKGCGFGSTGSEADPNQTWAHDVKEDRYVPTAEDNPAYLGPAGTVYCPLADWARFAQAHLGWAPQWLPASVIGYLHEAVPSSPIPAEDRMGLGWGRGVLHGVPVVAHDGSNGLNYARIMLFPTRRAGLLVTCNAGDERAAKAVNEASLFLTERLLGRH
jgi:CubicO group peptidase (beta-lactamase class C family)